MSNVIASTLQHSKRPPGQSNCSVRSNRKSMLDPGHCTFNACANIARPSTALPSNNPTTDTNLPTTTWKSTNLSSRAWTVQLSDIIGGLVKINILQKHLDCIKDYRNDYFVDYVIKSGLLGEEWTQKTLNISK